MSPNNIFNKSKGSYNPEEHPYERTSQIATGRYEMTKQLQQANIALASYRRPCLKM